MLQPYHDAGAECGAEDDFYYFSPWRRPGSAPVIDACGIAGGRLPGQGQGQNGAEYVNTTHAKIGDLGSRGGPFNTHFGVTAHISYSDTGYSDQA